MTGHIKKVEVCGQTQDYGVSLIKGEIPGESGFTKFGRTPSMPSGASIQDVWQGSGVYTGQPVTNVSEIVTISSSSGNDTAAGTGARTVRIYGLETDLSTEYTSEDIILNGAALVDSLNTYYRINRVIVLTAGSSGGNEGIISVAHKITTANIFAGVGVGFNQTEIAAWTVAAQRNAILKRVRVALSRSNGSAGSATVTIRQRDAGQVYRAIRAMEVTTESAVSYTYFSGDLLLPGTDIKVSVEDVSGSNSIVEAALEFVVYSTA